MTGSPPKRRGELLGSLLVGFHSKVSTHKLSVKHKQPALAFTNRQIFVFQVILRGWQAKTLEQKFSMPARAESAPGKRS